jgi:hypothetical protein
MKLTDFEIFYCAVLTKHGDRVEKRAKMCKFQPFPFCRCLIRKEGLNMKLRRITFFVLCMAVFWSCSMDDKDEPTLSIFTEEFDFNEQQHEWMPGFSDYPADPEDSSLFELKSAYTEPIESKLTKRSVMLSGKNVNKDLFMYIKKKIENLKPDTDYTLTFTVELASDLNAVQTSQGGSLYLKAGATHAEPKSVIDQGQYVMNIDKGDQGTAGADMITLGDVFQSGTGTNYSLITRTNTMANSRYVARTNSNGELWLIVGTDATIGGTTKVFYTRVNVVFSAS